MTQKQKSKGQGRPSLRSSTVSTRSSTATAGSSTATGTEIELFCLIHGDPPNSYFSVTVGKHEHLYVLRKLIKKENDKFDGISPESLRLWVVDIPFNSPYLGDSNADIMNVLQGQEFVAPNTIEDIFPTQPNKKNIHIIVELLISPDSVSGTKRKADEEIVDYFREIKKGLKGNEEILKGNEEILKELTKERSAVSISKISYKDWNKIQERTGLSVVAKEFTVGSNPVDIPAFQWDDSTESAQHDKYILYLKDIVLRLTVINQNLVLIDTTNLNHYLETFSDNLPIKLTGTTDAVISDKCSVKSFVSENHVRILFELKKVIRKVNVYQAMAELLAADSNSQYPVLAVLTDLIDHWQFLFLGEGRKIILFTTTRSQAVALLRNELTATQVAGEAEQELSKRKKFVEFIGNSAAPADSNVSSDIAPMEDFFDTMTEEEIFRYKTKRILTPFFSHPIYKELDVQEKLPDWIS